VIIVVSFKADQEYPTMLKLHEETDIRKVLNWNMDFEHMVLKLTTLTKDLCAFFLLGLHITFPSFATDHRSARGQSMGLIALRGTDTYIKDVHSDVLSYPLLLEASKKQQLASNLTEIAKVWHKDVWSFHRFIKAVQSDHTTIDQFLDLVFTLESFFDKNTSTETMRLVTAVLAGHDRKSAAAIDQLVADCFLIRNEVVHGGMHYRLHDDNPRKAKGTQKTKMILELFWELKNLNIRLLQLGIEKLISDRNPIPAKSIRFSTNDIIDRIF